MSALLDRLADVLPVLPATTAQILAHVAEKWGVGRLQTLRILNEMARRNMVSKSGGPGRVGFLWTRATGPAMEIARAKTGDGVLELRGDLAEIAWIFGSLGIDLPKSLRGPDRVFARAWNR